MFIHEINDSIYLTTIVTGKKFLFNTHLQAVATHFYVRSTMDNSVLFIGFSFRFLPFFAVFLLLITSDEWYSSI